MEYFEEFKKHLSGILLKRTELTRYGVRGLLLGTRIYMVSTMKSEWFTDGIVPEYVTEEEWEEWKAYWDRDDVKEKARKAKLCRLSEPEGPGTCIIKHFGGSRNAQEYARILAKEQNVPEDKLD